MEICSTLQEKSWGYNSQARHINTDEAWAKLVAASTALAEPAPQHRPAARWHHPARTRASAAHIGPAHLREGWPAPIEDDK